MKIFDGLKLTLEIVEGVEGLGHKAATLLYLMYRHALRLVGVRKPYTTPVNCIYKTAYGRFKVRAGTNDILILMSEREIWDEFMVEGDVFIDAGAHIGKYSIMLSPRFRKVLAVEANPETFKLLEENIRLNKATNVKAINRALWCEDGKQLEFFITKTNVGASSLKRELIAEEGLTIDRKISVYTITLDTLLKKEGIKDVDLMKLDVEGAEYEALQGLNLDEHAVKKIIYEAFNQEYYDKVTSYLQKFDYKIHSTRHLNYWVAEKKCLFDTV
jgi:FkbM family methyltransferase